MPDQKIRLGQVLCFQMRQHRLNIQLIIRKFANVTDHGIVQQTLTKALTAPINHYGCKAAGQEITDIAAILFNIFGAPREHQDRALGVRLGGPMGHPNVHPVLCRQPKRLTALWGLCNIVKQGRSRGH